MKIAVLGGGHGAYAAAADLSEQGHEVRLWRRDAAALQPVVEHGSIVLKDAQGERSVPLALATPHMAQALGGAQLVVVPGPATAQTDIAQAMAPHLVSGQVVFLPPGSFGSVVMARTVRAAGNRADVAWAETGTLPYLARKHGPRTVNITIRAIHLPTGVYPACQLANALGVIAQAYPAVHACGNALSGALMNAGPIIHPPLVVMNAAPLQHFAQGNDGPPEGSLNPAGGGLGTAQPWGRSLWDIHTEGTQPAVRAVTDQLDLERIAIRQALGFEAPHYPLADHYNNDRWMYGDAHKKLQKSGDWREHIDLHTHRYVSEDVELGLAFQASVARWLGVDAPISHGLLAVVGGFLGRELRHGPRTLQALGLAGLSPAQLQQRLHEGEL